MYLEIMLKMKHHRASLENDEKEAKET